MYGKVHPDRPKESCTGSFGFGSFAYGANELGDGCGSCDRCAHGQPERVELRQGPSSSPGVAENYDGQKVGGTPLCARRR